jgi:hypothetical protein
MATQPPCQDLAQFIIEEKSLFFSALESTPQ